MDQMSLVAAGEARELLAHLRRNSRFSQWGGLSSLATSSPMVAAASPVLAAAARNFSSPKLGALGNNHLSRVPSEHSFVRELKDIRRGTGKSLEIVLKPFLEIIRSPEANGVITAEALASVETILERVTNVQNGAVAQHEVVEAVAQCRFEPTDPKIDEVVLSRIAEVLSMCITQETAPHLSDATLLSGLETCFRIATSKRISPLLASISSRALNSIIFVTAISAVPLGDYSTFPDQRHLMSAEEIREAVTKVGATSYSFEQEQPRTEAPLSTGALRSILLFASLLVDPTMRMSSALRHIGLQMLHAVLHATEHTQNDNGQNSLPDAGQDSTDKGLARSQSSLGQPESILLRDPSVRHALLREVSRSVLRALGLLQDPSYMLALSFTVSTSLLHVLGKFGLPFLSMLLQRVFPTYILGGTFDDKLKLHRPNQEIALEAIANILSQPDLISAAYAAIDCDPLVRDAVQPLIEALNSSVEDSAAAVQRLIASNTDNAGDGNGEEQWTKALAPGLLCADGLLSLAECINETVRATERVTDDVHLPEVHELLDEKKRKDRTAVAADFVNRLKSKATGKAVLRILAQHKVSQVAKGEESHRENEDGNAANRSAASDAQALDLSDGVSKEMVPFAAQFFRETPSLDKETIGVVLGEPDVTSRAILEHYTSSFEFTKRSITDAIRVFLESFRLPGEAQKIDRIMHSFANRYYVQNEPGTPLKNADVAYILAYAIVMLNTDQHNDSVKKKMSVEDFIRNNRGINDHEDLPREYLEDIFTSIRAAEIKMSDETGIDELTDIVWDETLQRAGYEIFAGAGTLKNMEATTIRQQPMRFLLYSLKQVDAEVFKISWRAVIFSAKLALKVAVDENEVQRAIEGFLSVARCADALRTPEAMNACATSLADASGLRSGPLYDATSRFGVDVRAQMSFVALAGIVRQCGDGLGDSGWSAFLSCVVRLHALGLTPRKVVSVVGGFTADLVDVDYRALSPSKMEPEWWPHKLALIEDATGTRPRAMCKSRNDTSSFWSLLGVSGNTDADKDNPYRDAPEFLLCENSAQEDARMLAVRSIDGCRLDEILVTETRFLMDESLQSLAKTFATAAISFLQHENQKQGTSSVAESIMDASEFISPADLAKTRSCCVAFLVDLLTELTIRNRDRVELVWPHCREVIQWLLANSIKTSVLTERAVVGLLRVSVRLLHVRSVRNDVLQGLNLLVNMSTEELAPIAAPVAAGIYHTIKLHSSHITKPSGWHTILTLVERLQKFPAPCPQLGFESLSVLLVDDMELTAVTGETFSPFIDTVCAYAVSTHDFAAAAVDLFPALVARIPEVKKTLSKGEWDEQDDRSSPLWNELWMPLLQAIAEVALQAEMSSTRLYALIVLESQLASRESEMLLPVKECAIALEHVVLPLVRSVFELTDKHFRGIEISEDAMKMRQRCMTIVMKTFLQHHARLAKELPAARFARVWVAILKEVAGRNCAGNAKHQEVDEYLNESLKNILLVMQANEILTPDRSELWEGTFTALEMLNPTVLNHTLLRVSSEPASSAPRTTAQKDPDGSPDTVVTPENGMPFDAKDPDPNADAEEPMSEDETAVSVASVVTHAASSAAVAAAIVDTPVQT